MAPTRKKPFVDPTTCDRVYAADEVEFMRAMDDYKKDNHRPYPTWSEVLGVVKALGYRKRSQRDLDLENIEHVIIAIAGPREPEVESRISVAGTADSEGSASARSQYMKLKDPGSSYIVRTAKLRKHGARMSRL